MDLLLLAIRTSRPIFVREGGGRGGGVPLQFSVIAARSTGDFYYTFYDFVHYLNQRPPFKGNFAPPSYVTREIWQGDHVCIGVQRAIFPPPPPFSISTHTLSPLSKCSTACFNYCYRIYLLLTLNMIEYYASLTFVRKFEVVWSMRRIVVRTIT